MDIKIRAWYKEYESMVYITDLYGFEVEGIHTFKEGEENGIVYMLSTGVKDINKKESYLGDILKKPKPKYGEYKEEDRKAFYIIKKEKDNNNMYLEYNFNIRGYWEKNNLQLCRINDLEIVGNIYLNKDMIKKEE